mgnify:CR=1 FL=1
MSGIYHEWNGTVLTITSDSGTSSADLKGATGDTGIRGPQGPMGNSQTIDLENYYTKEQVDTAIENVEVDLTGYATETYVNDTINTLKDSGEINGEDGVGIVNIYDSYISSNPDDTTHMLTILTSDGKQYAIEFNDGENGIDGVNGSGIKLWDNRTGETEDGYYHNSTVKGGVIAGDILLTTNGDLYYVDEAGPIFFKPSFQYNIFDGDFTVKDSAKLGGKAPEYYTNPRNLLDNSYFVNPINQRGQTTYTINGYTIDRWIASKAQPVIVNTDGITLDGTNGSIVLIQRLNTLKDGTYTVAIKVGEDIQVRQYKKEGTTYTRIYTSGDYLGGYVQLLGNNGVDEVQFRANSGNIITAEWVALYEGEYTADTLPEYQYKGYAVELAECQRYYQYHQRMDLFGYTTTGSTDYCMFIDLPVPMRIRPSVSILNWVARSAVGGYSKHTNNTPTEPTALRTYGGNDTNCSHFCIADRIAISAGDTNNSILAYTVNGLTFSADL